MYAIRSYYGIEEHEAGSHAILAVRIVSEDVVAEADHRSRGPRGRREAERQARVAKAQGLMREAGVGALLLEPGSSMLYFTGISWWRSERLTAVVIPAEGEIGVVTPYFEEPSVRESMA